MQLTRVDDLTTDGETLAVRHGGRVGLAAVLGDLDRRLRRTVAPCLSRHRAWTWDRADRGDGQWWPQGVSPAPSGDVVAVTWYSKDRRSRISFVDLERRRYRHVELVRPTPDGHEPLRIHAGGLAWRGSTLHVAATRGGLWVCDTDDVVRTADAYVLPARHRLTADEPFTFSFVSSAQDGLVVGEYGNRQQTHRIARVAEDGSADVVDLGVLRAQGVAVAGDTCYATASHGARMPGSLWTGLPGAMRERRYALPMGPEDLAYDGARRRLWTVTEHPHRRWIVSLRPPQTR